MTPRDRADRSIIAAAAMTRRHALLLPLVLTACFGGEEPVFTPLRYDYLPPLQLNVATIEVEQRFIPSGVRPDISAEDPEPPVEALRAMGTDRLKAFGLTGRAVFAILDATMTKRGDNIQGSMGVSLTIYAADGSQGGFAEAHVEHSRSGDIDNLRKVLYDITKAMMDSMNVEFEFQVRHNLHAWLTTPTAPGAPVEQAPLNQPPAP
jgi:hypothetical protein